MLPEVFVQESKLPRATVADFQRDVAGAALSYDLLKDSDWAAVVCAEAGRMDGAKVMSYLPRHVADFVGRAYESLAKSVAYEFSRGRSAPRLKKMEPPPGYVSIDVRDPLGTQAYDEYLQSRTGA
jgi:hypothetical protein